MFLIYDLQESNDASLIDHLDEAKVFLLNLWDDLDEDNPFLKEIEKANFDEIKSMLEGNDYTIIKASDYVWLCDACDELYEEFAPSCQKCNCSSVRMVHKGDMGL
jgi:hypothetical protein